MGNPATGDLLPGSLAWSVVGALWTLLLALMLGAAVLRGSRDESALGTDDAPPAAVGRVLTWFVSGVLLQSLVWLGLSAGGLLRAGQVIAVAAVFSVVAFLVARKPLAETLAGLRIAAHDLRLQRPAESMAAVVVLATFLLTVLRLALLPTIFYDDLVYHLGLPRQALLLGHWPSLEHFMHSYMPATWESCYLLPLSLGGSSAPQFMNVMLLGMLALAIHRVAWRTAGRKAALMATCLLLVAPMFLSLGSFAGNDLFVALALGVALDRVLETRGERLLEVGILAGAAWGTKYASLPAIAGLCVAAVHLRSGAWMHRVAGGATLGVVAILAPCAWTLRCFVLTGSPLYPAFFGVLGGRHWNTISAQLVARDSGHGAIGERGVAVFWESLLRLVHDSSSLGHPGGINAAFPLVVALGLLLWRRVRHATALLAVASLAWIGWCVTSLNLRYAIILLVALTPFAAAALKCGLELLSARASRAVAATAGVLVLMLLCVGPFLEAVRGHLASAACPSFWDAGPRSEFLLKRVAMASASHAMAERLPPGARVLVIGEARLAFLPRPAVVSTAYDSPGVEPYLEGLTSVDELNSRVARDFSHVLVNFKELRRFREHYEHDEHLTIEERRLLSEWLAGGMPQIASWGEVSLFEIPGQARGD